MRGFIYVTLLLASFTASCSEPQLAFSPTGSWEVVEVQYVDDLASDISLLETVFWEPLDTFSLRKLIRETPLVQGKSVLEIGTGSGLISLCALHYGASQVVATDVNPAAVANARYNAINLGVDERLEVRQVSLKDPAAFAVIAKGEKFDLIVSNPPWVDQIPADIADFALYDQAFLLMRTLLDGVDDHLNPGGRILLAYGSVSGIRMLMQLAVERGMTVEIIEDDRDLDDLEEEFLPGMLLEVKRSSRP